MLTINLEIVIPFAIILAVCIVLLVFVIRLGGRVTDLEKRLKRLTRGKSAVSLEAEIVHLFEANDILTDTAADIQKKLDQHARLIDTCYRKTGLIKYDAFNQMGGKLSFALALLDEQDNGLILNSVHSQEGNYTYVKEVKDGKCDIELGTEETQALERAIASE